MTVKELIEKLKEYPPENDVFVLNSKNEFVEPLNFNTLFECLEIK